jgi:glutathione synthase/RimK-type ligase-like ATP-grasp enzyme
VGTTDYRLDNDLSFGWKEWKLPPEVEKALLQLVRRFGLNYSAADIILTPDDEYVFLEINSAGEWVWLARDLGLPIASALVEVLTVPERRLIAHEEQW